MTVDINRNMRYRSSNRPGSPDINNLRVEIIYHKNDMLQFKVSVFLSLCASGGATSLPVTVSFFKFNASILLACSTLTCNIPSCLDTGPNHRTLWGSGRAVCSCHSQLRWEQQAVQGPNYPKPLRYSGLQEEHGNQDVSVPVVWLVEVDNWGVFFCFVFFYCVSWI